MMITPFLEKLKEQKRYAVGISVAGNSKLNPLGLIYISQLALAYGY
ncbi:MAG: hypothetical protein PWQ37_2670 [Candidatus Petromonas sp.]|jgi:hypothetical protein|nr:hypothetical protein [Candidatus Petromonas sp.]